MQLGDRLEHTLQAAGCHTSVVVVVHTSFAVHKLVAGCTWVVAGCTWVVGCTRRWGTVAGNQMIHMIVLGTSGSAGQRTRSGSPVQCHTGKQSSPETTCLCDGAICRRAGEWPKVQQCHRL